jgi:hypothetical protein
MSGPDKTNQKGLTLTELGLKYGTDKAFGTKPLLTETYPQYLERFRFTDLTFLEIGTGKPPRSANMWLDYFYRRGSFYTIDNISARRRHLPTEFTFLHGEQGDRQFMRGVADRTGPLDVVVDDGSHVEKDQRASLEVLWPYVKPGGLYIIEDIAAFWDKGWRYRQKPEDVQKSIIETLDSWRANMIRRTDSDVVFIHYYHKVVILGKRNHEE